MTKKLESTQVLCQLTYPNHKRQRQLMRQVASQRGNGEGEDIRLGVAADEVIGTFTTSEPLLVDEAPREIPHCSGMLRHEDRLALALDLKRMMDTFPVGVI